MKRFVAKSLLTATLLGLSTLLFAQKTDDPVLLTVGGENVTKSEFLKVYNKNNLKKDVIDKKSLEEYLDLYINFKLKVKEAESLGMDTVKKFITELAGYRKQLAQPYLVDKDVNDKLLQEAFDRMQWDIRASHILIKVSSTASPADTMAAYKKIMAIRDRIVKGESFAKLAVELSEDPSARDQAATGNRPFVKGNAGDLGYFTALDLVYPFETAAYNTKVGEISMPVRTDFGYHLIKVADKKAAMGKVQVAHLLITIPANSTKEDSAKLKAKIYEISDSIKAGASFEAMVKKYSDDKASAPKGGVLPWFGVNRMVPEFIVAISKLKNKGDISDPVQTTYGWHIIKFLDRKPAASVLDSVKTELKSKIAKDSRSSKSKESMVAKIKKEYNFNETDNALNDFCIVVDTIPVSVKSNASPIKTFSKDTLCYGKWTDEKYKNLSKIMFQLGDKTYTQKDFAVYLKSKSPNKKAESISNIKKSYKQFTDDAAIDYEDSHLEAKYPEFKDLMKEYRDGILLFELTDQKVWTKAVKDTTGLASFYEKNKNNYMWGDRVDATIYTCANPAIAKTVRKYVKKGKLGNDEILKLVNKDSQLNLKIESDKYSRKENDIIDTIPWVPGLSGDVTKDKSVAFVKITKLIPAEPKTLNEAKGMITADYQTYLEKEWITELKGKYPVVINKDVFSAIK